MNIFKYFKRRKIVKKVNKALMIKLHKSANRRMAFFLYYMQDIYNMLVFDKAMKGELRDIRFSMMLEGKRLI